MKEYITAIVILLSLPAFSQCTATTGSQINNYHEDSLSFSLSIILTVPPVRWDVQPIYHSRAITATIGGVTLTDTFSTTQNSAAGFRFPNQNYTPWTFHGFTMQETLFGLDTVVCPMVAGTAYVLDPFAARP